MEAYTDRKREKICAVVDFAEKIFAIFICRNHYSLSRNHFISGNTFSRFHCILVRYVMLHPFFTSVYFLFSCGICARKSTLRKLGGYR